MWERARIIYLLPFCIAVSIKSVLGTINVTWTSPVSGDVYGPGDTVIGKWDAVKPVVSPSFRLCLLANDTGMDATVDNLAPSAQSCGATVWPTVERSTGTYSVSLAIPNVTSQNDFRLQMEDDFGETALSPFFTLSPTTDTPNEEDDSPDSSPSVAPDAENPSGDEPPAVSSLEASPSGAYPASSTTAISSTNPNLIATRNPAPAAAFAVPLSLVATILLVAAVLSLHHRRKLNKERAHDTQKRDLSRQSSLKSCHSSSSASKDIEKAVNILFSTRSTLSYGTPAAPAENKREPRQATRQPYPVPHGSVINGHNTVPASVFKASTYSPRPPHTWSPRVATSPRDAEDEDDDNATVTGSIISNYFHPSPVPPSPLLSVPPESHTRGATTTYCNEEKPLPLSPRTGQTRSLYDVVAKALGRGRAAGILPRS